MGYKTCGLYLGALGRRDGRDWNGGYCLGGKITSTVMAVFLGDMEESVLLGYDVVSVIVLLLLVDGLGVDTSVVHFQANGGNVPKMRWVGTVSLWMVCLVLCAVE